ncbi:hypothetical protein EWM64_g7942 [Hericium alpestre]|uniref:F-box domain-containing protein n=1 Tax=Hericium alpestre TaxID=135208 RepID=A0A4Y9ZQG8_9AGAM|nr:hypothetical protein EWM64_g7942 [Hericium alpestre]
MTPSTLIGAGLNALDEDALFHIFSTMTFEALATFRMVSKHFKIMADTYIFHLWHKALSTFVDDVEAFCHLLQQFRAVVSGSVTLHVILHATRFLWWKPNDMDICCCLGQADKITDFLCDSFGYHRLDESTDVAENYVHDYQGAVASVICLHHPMHGMRIDIISTPKALPKFPIPAFWGTLVMN